MKQLIIAVITAAIPLMGFGWGQKGHDVTAAIAEKHLTARAVAMTDRLLEGKTLVYWANWLDNASYTPELRYTKTWHYKNVNAGVRYEEMSANPSGDVVTAIKSRMEILQDSTATKEDKMLALKILIHLVGDLHQPLHMGHATDLGGNRIKVKFFDQETNLHSVWDTSLPEAVHKWSYSEWREQLDRLSAEEIESIIFPGITDECEKVYTPKLIDLWAKEGVEAAAKVYSAMPSGTKIRYDEIAWSAPIIEEQLLKGGLRLAFLLNIIAE